jgi:hypothetical protein
MKARSMNLTTEEIIDIQYPQNRNVNKNNEMKK